ncbi:MAG: hypothetical protein VB095_02615 [Anaerovorax sp.]|nr:hypothetical protein [Anaerovorax sp.]
MVNRKILSRSPLLLLLLLTSILFLSGSRNFGAQLCTKGDLDGDGITEEYNLTDHVLIVEEGSQEIWRSSHDYYIDSFSLGDINNDGEINLVVSLWKKGSFGEMKPFWHTGKDNDYKNHLFVYQLKENTFRHVWCSSNLDHPILSFDIKDNNGDGLNELVVEEGEYKKTLGENYVTDPNGTKRTVIWQWEEWGFRLQKIL